MKKLALVIGAGTLIAGTLYFFVSFSAREDFRKDRADAHDLIHGGWISVCISQTAHNIRTKHDVASNEVWGRYEYGAMPFDCPAEVTTHPRLPRSPHVAWWPSNFPLTGKPIYALEHRGVGPFAVVDSSARTVFFWRTES